MNNTKRVEFLMKSKGKNILMVLCIIIIAILTGVGGFFAFNAYSINKKTKMTFNEMLAFTTNNNDTALITVGFIKNGKTSCMLYGKNGAELPYSEHIYEIGSVTKTFTASLLFKAIIDGKIMLDDSIDEYLDLPPKDYYPTIKRLITHTSGYKSYYINKQFVLNYFRGKNVFSNFSKNDLIERLERINLIDKDYSFNYSNLGIAAIGAVISEIYKVEYTALMNKFITVELGLPNTKISNGSGDLEKYWNWMGNDAFIPAGALVSTIDDMLKYAQLQMSGTNKYLSSTQKILANVNVTSTQNENMNIHIDSMGAAWIIDEHNNIVWHNGGTGHYNCYIGFDMDKQIAVVILSNLPPGYRIPATVMGIKLLNDLKNETFDFMK